MENILRLRHEAARLLDFSELRRVRARHSHGAQRRRSARVPARARAVRARRRAQGIRGARSVRGPQAQRVGRRLLRRSACSASATRISQEELRPYFPLPHVLERPVPDGGAAVRRAHPASTTDAPRLASGRALLRHRDRCRRARSAASISMPTRARTSAAARGWTNASAASSSPPARRCRSPISSATSCRRTRTSPRC